MSLVLTTRSVLDEDKLDYWHTALGEALGPMSVTAHGGDPIEGRVTAGRLGHLKVCAIESDAQRASRKAAPVATSAQPYLALGTQIRGTATLIQHGRTTTVNERDLVVIDTARPYTLDYPRPFVTRVIHLPRQALGLREEQIRRVTGTAIDTRHGAGSALMPYLTTLAVPEHTYPSAIAGKLAANILEFFSALVAEHTGPADTQPGDVRRHLVLRIRNHIDTHLADPALSPATIADALHISVRYLHRLFEDQDTTVARLIQRRRLEESARELAHGGAYAPSVSAVAQRWGFISPPHFSRAFRNAYGQSPLRWRQVHAATKAGHAVLSF